jgi:hypothetical protein
MTRIEVAALTLALHVLRRSVRYRSNPCPPSALDTGAWYAIGDARGVVCEGVRDATWYPFPRCGTADGSRILRARLALYLRAVLRMEAAERGDLVEHAEPSVSLYTGAPGWAAWGYPAEYLVPGRPLWTSAPPHKETP